MRYTWRRTRQPSTPAESIIVSFSSWNGEKMHGNRGWLTELKGELGFDGFVVSDWQGIDQIPGKYTSDVVTESTPGSTW